MQRISAVFEERFVAILRGMLTEKEQDEIDYELASTVYPKQEDDGSMGLSMGMSVSLAMPAITIGDHVMVSGLVQDPYAADTILTINATELLEGLRERRAAQGSLSNGGLIIPGKTG
jgi:hypothetical protein